MLAVVVVKVARMCLRTCWAKGHRVAKAVVDFFRETCEALNTLLMEPRFMVAGIHTGYYLCF